MVMEHAGKINVYFKKTVYRTIFNQIIPEITFYSMDICCSSSRAVPAPLGPLTRLIVAAIRSHTDRHTSFGKTLLVEGSAHRNLFVLG